MRIVTVAHIWQSVWLAMWMRFAAIVLHSIVVHCAKPNQLAAATSDEITVKGVCSCECVRGRERGTRTTLGERVRAMQRPNCIVVIVVASRCTNHPIIYGCNKAAMAGVEKNTHQIVIKVCYCCSWSRPPSAGRFVARPCCSFHEDDHFNVSHTECIADCFGRTLSLSTVLEPVFFHPHFMIAHTTAMLLRSVSMNHIRVPPLDNLPSSDFVGSTQQVNGPSLGDGDPLCRHEEMIGVLNVFSTTHATWSWFKKGFCECSRQYQNA